MNQVETQEVPLWFWGILALVLLAQSTFLFIQAKRINKAPWFWGVIGLIQVPMPTIIFFVLKRFVWKTNV